MVDMKVTLDMRSERRQERVAKVARGPGIRVLPKNDKIRKYIKHYPSGIGFPSGDGSVEWPNDRFTQRRLRDGDVTIEQKQNKLEASKKE